MFPKDRVFGRFVVLRWRLELSLSLLYKSRGELVKQSQDWIVERAERIWDKHCRESSLPHCSAQGREDQSERYPALSTDIVGYGPRFSGEHG